VTALDPLLLEVLACPVDKGPLVFIAEESLLYNPRLQRAYVVDDGVPVMLVEESRRVDGAEHQRLVALAQRTGAPSTGSAGGPGGARS